MSRVLMLALSTNVTSKVTYTSMVKTAGSHRKVQNGPMLFVDIDNRSSLDYPFHGRVVIRHQTAGLLNSLRPCVFLTLQHLQKIGVLANSIPRREVA
ncbi:uncharacterized protein F5147DRAFT_117841 [Suillus discolor]|uniref:Uncharacterized protein n=1 Tax=Suillus discolor TaxID=1912936 RepID=A0A9P7K0C7_9AGAM|nr:uncharacterized protein F5147DRAFT_117841 [Suillus discolor]KAG2119600.1 hypothetical protein F5147DRAFT_117841 [Suillus discolor]